jgi:photosystem II stability/assembly factor-like uncharacterized protein
MRNLMLLGLCVAAALPVVGQFDMQHSGTTASLRGIDSVGKGVAWASGTGGTVLRTVDGGKTWEHCAVPPDAEKLDFRGVQAFDDKTAVVMSSGKGDLSRLYKTVDGCKSWKLVFTNPNDDGFWDSVRFVNPNHGYLLGDPVLEHGEKSPHFFLAESTDGGVHWTNWHDKPDAQVVQRSVAFFAASNSSMLAYDRYVRLAGGGDRAYNVTVSIAGLPHPICNCSPKPDYSKSSDHGQLVDVVPMKSGESAGVFSMAEGDHGVMFVGGDYKTPDSTDRNAYFLREMKFPLLPDVPPHGYRSSVAFDQALKTWITVGPNGTDVSTDDGRNWKALKPGAGDDPGADRDWNALSLPFVVGPKGRIGVLRSGVLGLK